ncbi:MAG: insulinase family protein [Bacteroidales bacterium]|nr:insulinase family protein [Bacteroidales bacterium]
MIWGKAECGMLYAVKRSGSAVGYCALSIRCGTRNEEGFHSGIAHFTEHTIFKGTSRRSSACINNYLDRLGGELNAYTTKEELVIHSTVLKEDLRKAANLLMELATCPTFPQHEIDTERGVVIEEIKSYKDSPADDVYDQFEGMLFQGHPLERPILGTVDSVKKISSEELRRFVSEKFVPEAMAFTVVADIDEKILEKKVLKLIGSWYPDHSPQTEIAGVRPSDGRLYFNPQAPVFDKTVDKRNHEVNAVMGYLAPSLYEEKERITAVLLGNILAGPASNSILNSVLREKNGWVYGVESAYTQYSDTGVMAISLGCEKPNVEKCRQSIEKELEKLRTVPLSPARLKAAKKQLLGQLAISSDNGESQCLSMGKSLLAYGRISPDNEIRTHIEEISSEDLRQMACRIFGKEKISRLVFL